MEGQKSLFTGGSGARDERYDEYLTWIGSRTAEDFVVYVKNVRGVRKLSHSGILKDAGIAESLARSNPLIKEHLEGIEQELIKLGHIPSPDQQDTSNTSDAPKEGTSTSRPPRSARDKRRIEELEQEVANLRLERDDARKALDRYGMLEKYMSETMRLIR